MAKSTKAQACPCGSGNAFLHCCAPYLAGELLAPDAQALMRSRYTAYTLEDEAYLKKTWYPTKRPAQLPKQEQIKWVGLTVLSHQQNQQAATVEFIAQFKVNGRANKMRETSRFVFEDGQWFYLDGDVLND